LTLYADIDGVLTQPIEPLIELIGDRPFASQVQSWSNETGTEWPCQWLSFWEVKAEFNLPKKFRLPELNSSFLAWDKKPGSGFGLGKRSKQLPGVSYYGQLGLLVSG